MLSENEVKLFQKHFQKFPAAKNVRLYSEGEHLFLDLSEQLGGGHDGIFCFNHEDITDAKTFAKALMKKAHEYDPIDAALFAFDCRRKELGDEEAKKWLRCNLERADFVDEALTHIALIVDRIYLATCSSNELPNR